ncbi:MAG: class I SAM-dependent methyltransferase [Bacteroidota bacterium]
MLKEFWNDRYKNQDYAYGTGPNLFFKEWLQKLEPGSILMPADGEGRNGVFAAQLGWQVTSVDLSVEGRSKALALAEANQVRLDYLVGDLAGFQFEKASFDVIGLIYAHFPAGQKSIFHQKLNECLKPGGAIILEAFNKQHLNLNKLDPKVGGPKELAMLYSAAELHADFPNYEIELLAEKEILLEEGQYHVGKGAVVQFVGIKQ